MEAIPVIIRQRIIKLYEQGKPTGPDRPGLGLLPGVRVRQHFRERGTLEPCTHLCGRTGKFTPQRQARLQALLLEKPDATLKGTLRQDGYKSYCLDDGHMDHASGIHFKKVLRQRAGAAGCGAKAAKAGMKISAGIPPEKFVFIDESGANMTCVYARANCCHRSGCWPKRPTATGRPPPSSLRYA